VNGEKKKSPITISLRALPSPNGSAQARETPILRRAGTNHYHEYYLRTF
jgi:hypothetical protein